MKTSEILIKNINEEIIFKHEEIDNDFNTTVLKALKEVVDFRGADFSNMDIKKLNVSYARLEDCSLFKSVLTCCSLVHLYMARSFLNFASFKYSFLSCVNFRDSTAIKSNFLNCELNNVVFNESCLQEAKFCNSDIKVSKFNYACLFGADFSNTKIEYSDFTCANLLNANFKNAVLDSVDFCGSKLESADFTGAILKNVNFKHTCLEHKRNNTF